MMVNGKKCREIKGFWLNMARYGSQAQTLQTVSLRSASVAVAGMLNKQ